MRATSALMSLSACALTLSACATPPSPVGTSAGHAVAIKPLDPPGIIPLPGASGTGAPPATSFNATATRPVPPGMQYLYGSGEAAALSYQAYRGLIDRMKMASAARGAGKAVSSVVLTPEATLAAPRFAECGAKPLAAVFDVDETVLLNLGYEADDARRGGAYDAARWDRWERTGAGAVAAVPGMAEVVRAARAAVVTLVFNTNRASANVADTASALDKAGLGPVRHLDTLWLQGDVAAGPAKDPRRAAIAARYCVVAMAGDQLGDFSDLFNAAGLDPATRRALTGGAAVQALWGNGWYVLPNPVYGSGLKGDLDQVFPADRRWVDPGPAPATDQETTRR